MGVATRHPDYATHLPMWRQLRAQDKGEWGVKDATGNRDRVYLPPVSQAQVDNGGYEGYKARAEYVDFLGRTVAGLVGAVMQKAPEVTGLPDAYLDNIDNRGTPLDLFAKECLREILLTGRIGLLVERPRSENGRSYLVRYRAEQITNWEETEIDSEARDLRVVLMQTKLVRDEKDEFQLNQETYYRVLDLMEGRYVQSVWEQRDSSDFEKVDEITPTRNGAALDRIPFVFVGPTSLGQMIECSPVMALANVNLHHYQLSADLRDALFKLSKPKGILFTMEEIDQIIYDDTALKLAPGDDAKFLEYAGTGLDQIREEMTADEQRMVVLGARLLEGQKRAAETAEALRLRQSGEQATLHDAVITLSLGLTRALRMLAEWDGVDATEVEIDLNRDFHGAMPSPEEIAAHLDLVSDRNGVTLEDHHQWLYKSGLTMERDFETWRTLKDEEAPPPPPALPVSPFGGPARPGASPDDVATDEEAA